MDKDLQKSTKTGDASPLTTSSESETFDTWTVITDKTKDLTPEEVHFEPLTPELTPEEIHFDDEMAADALRVEVLKASDDLIESRYNDIDDLSDGISIISESESAGRLSPHPELRKHLSDLNIRFISSPSMPLPMPSTPPKYESYSEQLPDTFHRVEPLVETNPRPQTSSRQLVETTEFQPPLPRYGLRGLFYVGALLAVLAFISKVKYDAWESVLGAKTDMLQQKITDLELKNNLMRAEIDILSKQVNYLTTLSENKKYPPSSTSSSTKSKSGEKKVKVWPGNGNTIEEVEIPAKDIKKPFKCDGHNNVNIAGMCIELPRSQESIVDSIGEKVRTIIDENEYLSNFEKVVDKMAQMAENPFGENPTEATPPPKMEVVTDPEPEFIPHEHIPGDSKKHDKRDNHKKHPSKYDSGESKERERSSRRDRSNENRDGERYKKSKEEYRKYDKRSSSEYENAKREADGQWHEKMMQHRENSRKAGDKHRHDNNWYIERGDSREQIRSTEHKYRGAGQR